MLLPTHEFELFSRLHRTLMHNTCRRLKVLPNKVASPEEFTTLAPELRLKVSRALSENLDVIDTFAAENPAHSSEDELDIVRSFAKSI